jgi:hypothetical protein
MAVRRFHSWPDPSRMNRSGSKLACEGYVGIAGRAVNRARSDPNRRQTRREIRCGPHRVLISRNNMAENIAFRSAPYRFSIFID